MDIKDLDHFRTIAESGTLSKASAKLRIAQPALSRKIQKMEHELGVQLLRRTARGVTPTEAGKVLLQRAIRFAHDFDEMRLDMAKYAQHAVGTLRIGIQSPLAPILAPKLLKRYRETQPDVILELTEGFSGELIDGLLNEHIDIAVADVPTHPHAELTHIQLWVDNLWLIGAVGSIFGRYPKGSFLRVEHLQEFPIIMPSQRHAIRVAVDTAFDRQHLRFRPALEANGALMILQLVKSGFGYSLMPSKRVQPLEAGGEFEVIAVRPHIRRTMSIVTRSALTGDPRLTPLPDIIQRLVSENIADNELLPSLFSLSRPKS